MACGAQHWPWGDRLSGLHGLGRAGRVGQGGREGLGGGVVGVVGVWRVEGGCCVFLGVGSCMEAWDECGKVWPAGFLFFCLFFNFVI